MRKYTNDFAGIAALTLQISQSARGAKGMALAALGVAFALRAVGDALGEVGESGVEVISRWPSWISPIGWGQQMKTFYDNSWWILLLFLDA